MSDVGPVASVRPERCAPRADRRGDDMLGTAFPAARLLLVEQPFPWGPEGLRTSRFGPETAVAVEARARAEGVRVQAIRRPGQRPGDRAGRRRWAVVDTREPRPHACWGEFSDDRELLDVALDGSTGRFDEDPFYLVCTHGRHDPCCAQRGRPLCAALASVRPDRVWQASHLGGCRFAPTVLVLPLGLVYGRVPPSTAPRIVAAAEAGEVIGPLLRGRVGVAPAAQAAIGFAHEQLGLPRSRDVAPVSITPAADGVVHVEIDTPRGRFDVAVRRDRVDATGLTCAAPGPSWFVAHRPQALSPVSVPRAR